MKELIVALNVAFANTFCMYFKAHSYHWNVEGPMFTQYHDFFGSIYTEVYGAVDPFAEHIRATDVDSYSPHSLSQVSAFATVKEDEIKGDAKAMVASLIDTNDAVIESLNHALKLATAQDEQGLINFLAGRLDVHAKHGWQLKASNK